MFNKILIANRGEIACRVIRTARRLGMLSVAVYSDADVRAMHVDLADEAYRLGAAPAADSYLNIPRIIEACRSSGAEAVHPGYGFLSENPDFAEAVEAAGITFIGPRPSAIRAMALKDAAKALMQRSGIPTIPGYHGDAQNSATLLKEAGKIGFPVLIKARAGGGGKGMRRVDTPAEFELALAGAQREARGAFGDERCLIEKYLVKPRHIEMQVFGDTHGNVVHLFERDCSLQRRHQKVIEEAPAPGLDPKLREALGGIAVRAAKAIDYTGAGTIEFIADVSEGLRLDRIYFMEMNTRLQVEHPVTECITRQDLVEWQLRVAAGEPLPLKQADLAISGWSMEARIYAEDPSNGFLPMTGKLDYLSITAQDARVDIGVRQGDLISPYYDPMLAKIIVSAPTRAAALGKLTTALQACRIGDVPTNVPFLTSLCKLPDFVEGRVDTGLIERNLDVLIRAADASVECLAVASVAALGLGNRVSQTDSWHTLVGWRLWSDPRSYFQLHDGETVFDLCVVGIGPDRFILEYKNRQLEFEVLENDNGRIRLSLANKTLAADAVRHGRTLNINLGGKVLTFDILDSLASDDETDVGGDAIVAPMPGFIKLISTQAGTSHKKGDVLIVLEAMKMEHSLRAPREGIVAEILTATGEHVQNGVVLLKLRSGND